MNSRERLRAYLRQRHEQRRRPTPKPAPLPPNVRHAGAADVLPCLLCYDPPAFVVVFQPHDQYAVGAPPGKTRLAVYTLCRPCLESPDGLLRAEDKVLREAAEDAANN